MDYEKMIREALARVPEPTQELRVRVYRSAMTAFEKKFGDSDPESLSTHRTLLSNAIQSIESDFAFKQVEDVAVDEMSQELDSLETPPPVRPDLQPTPPQVVQDQASYETAQIEPSGEPVMHDLQPQPDPAPQMYTEQPMPDMPTSDPTQGMSTDPLQSKMSSSNFPYKLYAIVGAIVLVIIIAFYFLIDYLANRPVNPIRVNIESSNAGPSLRQAETNLVIAAQFPKDLKDFSTSPTGTGSRGKITALNQGGKAEIESDVVLFNQAFTEIDATRYYTGRLEARFISDEPTKRDITIHAGFATFDKKKHLRKIA